MRAVITLEWLEIGEGLKVLNKMGVGWLVGFLYRVTERSRLACLGKV